MEIIDIHALLTRVEYVYVGGECSALKLSIVQSTQNTPHTILQSWYIYGPRQGRRNRSGWFGFGWTTFWQSSNRYSKVLHTCRSCVRRNVINVYWLCIFMLKAASCLFNFRPIWNRITLELLLPPLLERMHKPLCTYHFTSFSNQGDTAWVIYSELYKNSLHKTCTRQNWGLVYCLNLVQVWYTTYTQEHKQDMRLKQTM